MTTNLARTDDTGIGPLLSEIHRQELEVRSAIDSSVIAERGYRTLRRADSHLLAEFRIRSFGDGLLLPMYRATGESIAAQFKPNKPISRDGRTLKYVSPTGRPATIDVHPRNLDRIRDVETDLWITEGIKKGDSLTSRGVCVVTLTGVFNWRSRFGTLGDWEDIPLRGRNVVICFDADAHKNANVARAMVRLGRWCKSKAARSVRYLIVPGAVNQKPTKGVDDFFAAGGTLADLISEATTTEPQVDVADDAFTDARLAETIANEAIIDEFLWCKGLGWLRWSRQRWIATSEESVIEAVRKFALKCFSKAANAGHRQVADGWNKVLSARRLSAIAGLVRGIVETANDVFDSDPEILNTPTGVVDLRTGQVHPHAPEFFLTKITRGSYRPELRHPDWEKAMTALPPGVHTWFQERVGQAITGETTPDGKILILQGGGENGKSALTTDGILPAFGDYASPASPKLFAARANEHSTERADLRGQRLVVAEELSENQVLNVTALKQITDVGSIKARHLYRDNITFQASHTLFVTTNYALVVHETDHGTWRRLALVPFPFRYRKPGEELLTPHDRLGDPHLKARLRKGDEGRHDAIVTWAVDGARRYLANGFSPTPAEIADATLAWRMQSDRILAFWDEFLVQDANGCIATTDMLFAFNNWLNSNNHHEWSKETFHSRFQAHSETCRISVAVKRPRHHEQRISRPDNAPPLPNRPQLYIGVRFRNPDDPMSTRSERTDLEQNSLAATEQAELREPSGHADHVCCQGGPIVPSCRLCKVSPVYWDQKAAG